VSLPTVLLKRGRDASLRRRHPWVFSGGIASVRGDPSPGETVEVRAHDGRWLARGAYSPTSQIRVRAWTFDEGQSVDRAFFRRRIEEALAVRSANRQGEREARRLVYSESDGLPGLIVDRYGAHVVVQFLSAGSERWRDVIVRELAEATACEGVYERSDSSGRRLEGLEERTGVLFGVEPPDVVEIEEGGCRLLVDVRAGHKTGFYLDQRQNRALVREQARDADVLNAFSYTGGFGIAALVGGARAVTNVESSGPANELARRNAELNHFGPDRFNVEEGDAFRVLRRFRDEARSFDIVILDPPKFAESAAQVERAARGYKDLNLLAFRLLRPGGLLFTFSCSGHMKPDLFQKIVADGALDAGRDARIVGWLHQAPDHPTALAFPEASYLKGLVVRAT
jgi:23S rRNA (cytosine1962-C5)-methyltransferase